MAEPTPCAGPVWTTHCCEYHGIHSDDDFGAARLKLDSARQIFEGLQGHSVPLQWSRRIDHWLASNTPTERERLMNHLVTMLVMAAVGWSSDDGTTLDDLQSAAHQLRAAGEA